ncbi:hypothetical protein [Breoghania sp.]|nr:hypothetical protein [Breoghania sp.]MDJ0930145.1 hypothetical protein [Breoghania sp.]
MIHLEREHTIAVAAAVDRVFPLLTPRGEKLWVARLGSGIHSSR